jgi:DNA primase
MEDIKNLLTSAGITIHKETPTHFIIKCLNPSHADSHPSLSIKKDTGQFKCFSCDMKGGYSKLYFLVTGKDYNKKRVSLDWLSTKIKKKEENKKILPEVKIIGTLHDPLKNNEIRNWLFINGIENDNFIKERNITYSICTQMIAEHLVQENPLIKYTEMQYRICSPIYKENKLINVEGRTYLDKVPKILYVKGGTVDSLYNFEYIDKTKDVIITEGTKGLWRVWNVNKNVVSMFHNLPTESQIKMFQEIKGNLIFFLDNDSGGKGKIVKGKEILKGTYQILLEQSEELKKRTLWVMSKKEKNDPNDCSYEEIETLLKKPFRLAVDPNFIYKKREVLI